MVKKLGVMAFNYLPIDLDSNAYYSYTMNNDLIIYMTPLNGTPLAYRLQPNPIPELDKRKSLGRVIHSDSNSNETTNKSKQRIFVICDLCSWATTYLDKSRLPVHDSRCSICQEIGLSSFPVLAEESYTYTYSEGRGVELSFINHRR